MTDEIHAAGLSEMNIMEQLGLLKSILNSSTEYSIIAIDLNGIILIWNVGAERLYGYTPSEVIGNNINILHDADDIKSDTVKVILEVVKEKETWSGEIKRIR